jgi:hypothetical protein
MSVEESNIALVRRIFHEGSSEPNPPSVVEEIFAPDFRCHGPPGVNHAHTGGAAGPELCMLQGAFTGVAFSIEEIKAEGERVTCRFVARGRQVAEFQGVKPSDRTVTVSGTTTFRVAGDKVQEGWGVLIWG